MARKSSRRRSGGGKRRARGTRSRGMRKTKNNVGFLRKSRGPASGRKARTKVSQLPSQKRNAINAKRKANRAKKLKPLKTSWQRRTKSGKVVTVTRHKTPKNALPR